MNFQEKSCVRSVRIALSLLACSTFAVSAVHAQVTDETKTDQKIQKVEITGSNIKRINSETASAVQVISRDEIARTGATTVREVLSTLTANTGALTDSGGSLSFAGGASGVSLRNLGLGSTLVLLNGRRISNYGLADGYQATFTNVDAIPFDIVDRYEILLDGASAIYGSDAVAGVINIITKKEFKGLTLQATGQGSTTNKKMDRNESVSATYGFGDLNKDGYNAYANVELFRRNPYTARDIFSNVDSWYRQYKDKTFGNTSGYSYPGNIQNPDTGAYSPVAGCANVVNNSCRYDRLSRVEVMPDSDRVNVISAGRMNFSEALSGFFEITYSKTKTNYMSPAFILASGANDPFWNWFDAKNNKVISYVEPQVPASSSVNPYGAPTYINYRFLDNNGSVFNKRAEADQYRVLAGFEGTMGAWDWSSAAGVMGAKSTLNDRYWPHYANFVNAIESGEYKFGGVNSAELLNRMFPNTTLTGETKQAFADVKASRELMTLGGGSLAIAFGAEARHESMSIKNSANLLNAEIVNATAADISGARNIYAAFAELNAPFTKELEANFAVRADKAGSADTSLVPKLGLRYQVSPALIVRGTLGQGFRAPNLPESSQGAVTGYYNSQRDPKRCDTATALADVLSQGNADDQNLAQRVYDSGCSVSVNAMIKGNPNLQPEKSNVRTMGLVFEPTKNISVALDYYHIERRNEIGTKSITDTLNQEDTLGGITRGAITAADIAAVKRARELDPTAPSFTAGNITGASQQYVNLNKTRVSGVDVDLKSKWDWGSYGKFGVNLKSTYQLDVRGWDTTTNDYTENLVGTYGRNRVASVLEFTLSKGEFDTGLRINHVSATSLNTDKYDESYTPEGCAAQKIPESLCRIEADTTADFSLSYSGIKNTFLTLNVINLFDRHSLINVRSDSSLAVRGRAVKLGLQYKF